MLLPLLLVSPTLLCCSTVNATLFATCCCHLLCSWLIVDSFFTLMWHSSHVSLSYAAATALLSASLLIAAPHCCQCHCCCHCHCNYCKLIVGFLKIFCCCSQSTLATAVFVHAVPLIDCALLRVPLFQCCPLSLHTLCALAGTAATTLAVAIFVGFQMLLVSMTVIVTAQKLMTTMLPLHHNALAATSMVHCMMLLPLPASMSMALLVQLSTGKG